ncbi:MAG: ABC transporter ATP-binding protein, partial [Chloroflexia bacterium]
MIRLQHLSYRYPESSQPALYDLTFEIAEGEFFLVTGPSGSGKSTLLRCLSGLVPHYYGGTISGSISVFGRDPVAEGPRAMSCLVGTVFQDPEAQCVATTVEDELAFALENQGLPESTMRRRIEEVLETLGIAELRGRRLETLSGGQRQRVAIGAVLGLQPRVLVLDEPTSQLDPQGAEEVMDALLRLNRELGLTVVLSEHRLERVIAHADRILYLPGPGEPFLLGDPRDVLARMEWVPPLAALGRALGWDPLPLTVREARPFVQGMAPKALEKPSPTEERPRDVRVRVRRLAFSYDGRAALRGVDLDLAAGEIVALMGPNGAGKTTLLKQLVGLLRPQAGEAQVCGLDTRHTPLERLIEHVGYVPQNPNALLFADTVREELDFTLRERGLPVGQHGDLPRLLGLEGFLSRYPRDLSVGERQRVALAAILVARPEVILLDEPTRGLDYRQKEALLT